jgi:hypothetical protein
MKSFSATALDELAGAVRPGGRPGVITAGDGSAAIG